MFNPMRRKDREAERGQVEKILAGLNIVKKAGADCTKVNESLLTTWPAGCLGNITLILLPLNQDFTGKL